MAIAEFSKVAGILIAALSQHHLSGFGIAQLNSITSTSFVRSDCIDHNKLWKILQVMGISDHLTCLLDICIHAKKQQLEPDLAQQTGSKLGKEDIKAP